MSRAREQESKRLLQTRKSASADADAYFTSYVVFLLQKCNIE